MIFKKIKPLRLIKKGVAKIEKIGNGQTDKAESEKNIAENGSAADEAKEKWMKWKQIKYIPKFLSKKEKLIIKISISIIVICLVLMAYIFLNENLTLKPAVGGTYTEIIVGSPQYINPLYAVANEVDRDLLKLTFAGLVKFDASQKIVPDLAKEWFIDEAGTTYTFQLRQDVYWLDEKQFTSEDVIFTFEAIQNDLYASPLKSSWSGVTIQAVDEFTIQFSLPEAYPSFLENMTLGILPSHLWGQILPENAKLAELNIKPVGLGPYRFESLTKDKQGYIKSYTLKRNTDYHLEVPFIEQITLKFQPTFEMAVETLKNKNADGLNFLPLNLKELLATRKDLNYYSLSLPQYTAIFFNTQNNENLKIKKFRQALELLIDKQKIVENILKGEAEVVDGPILRGFPGYTEDRQIEKADTDRAQKILAELGWNKKELPAEIQNENGQNGEAINGEQKNDLEANEAKLTTKYLFKGDDELQINLTFANQPQAIAVAEMIQKMWQAGGVKTNLILSEPSQIEKNIITPRAYEALLFGEILGSNPDLYAFWHSSQAEGGGLNLANFKNSQADKILEEIRKEKDMDKIAEYYINFDKILKDELPAIFLYNPNYSYVVSDKIKGITLERIISPTDRLNDIEKWYIKTKKGFK